MRERASTIEGYFKQIYNCIKNNKLRTRFGETDLTLDDILDLWNKQEGKCAISGVDMTWGYSDKPQDQYGKWTKKPLNASVDRIDSSKGYTKDNLWIICNMINTFKGSYDVELVYEISEKIVEKCKNQ